MRLREVRISGFRAVPVCAYVEMVNRGRGRSVRIQWATNALRVRLPIRAGARRPMLSAIMGANSAGKSTLLLALHTFFGAAVKLDAALFHGEECDEPIVVEVTVAGVIEQPTTWHTTHCTPTKAGWSLTVASVWSGERRFRLIRRQDGLYQRMTPRDRAEVEKLLPEWRVIWADRGLNHEASLERKGLLSDLIDALLRQAGESNNVLARLAALMREMKRLVARPAEGETLHAGWEPIVALEQRLAHGLAAITPQPKLTQLAPDTLVKVQRYLQEDRSDMLFARSVILVEGQAEYYALPAFARTLGMDLDRAGVSVVFVNGIGNFPTYHQILAAFQIPHVILMDGDGQQQVRQRSHAEMADALFVLPQDFEHLLAGALSPARLLALMNECLARRGKPLRDQVDDARRRTQALARVGKPLVRRVAGELLMSAEITEMKAVVGTLQAALTLSQAGQR